MCFVRHKFETTKLHKVLLLCALYLSSVTEIRVGRWGGVRWAGLFAWGGALSVEEVSSDTRVV